MGKDRIIWLDNLKGALILIVVLGHTILFTNHEGTGNLAYRIISSFWMPMFMFTSGFSSFRAEISWNIIKRRFYQLMIPFAAWSVVLCAINGTYHVEQMFLYPTHGVWFLFALFFIIVIHVMTCKFARLIKVKEELVVAGVAAMLWVIQMLTHTKLFSFDLISFHFFFYSLGFYSRKYYCRLMSIHPAWFFIMAMAFVVMAVFRHDSYFQMIHLPNSCYIVYLFICATLSLCPAVYYFSKYVNKSMVISKMGGGTLGVYVFHIAIYTLLIRLFGDLTINTLGGLRYTLYVIALWQVVFWISYGLTIITNKTKYLSIILLGKYVSK